MRKTLYMICRTNRQRGSWEPLEEHGIHAAPGPLEKAIKVYDLDTRYHEIKRVDVLIQHMKPEHHADKKNPP